ncbi:phenylacetate--CoA ligase family protein [Planctomonas sp. JC2975]|uniref:phenylacetate--CoA ligase family protein n=1 Tax=Planctomonas sp. JC2975 TaxID=2729626 RepID=UPI0014748108|nr:phenylacetate--CoA ligase family protein [Planctomonas sp. JC2975]NNC13008.1 phenylacetate--CoA ligase family protein [Planctomonas sp. JC2975]
MTATTRDLARDARRSVREGQEGIRRRQRDRVADLVAFARERSPYYRDLYRGLPDRVDDTSVLPVTRKSELMAHFDDWVTDRDVTRERVEAFAADPELVGHPFLDRYLVATTSGTSGIRGLFVFDERALAMESALGSRASGLLSARDVIRMLAKGARTAVVTAPGGHFFTVAGTRRFQLDHPALGKRMQVFSIAQPLDRLVDQLNGFDPAMLSGFLGMLTILAGERQAGRLRIHPAVVIPGGETLTPEVRDRLTTSFGATVRAAYAATECSYLGIGCSEGWYHINSDWAVLEAVDANHRPVAPGTLSHTALLTNLANRVQPVLRYDLGDSIVMRPDACPCGSIFPAVRVQGRAMDMLSFTDDCGRRVELSPMLFGTLLDRLPGVQQYQLLQTDPHTLRVRLSTGGPSEFESSVWSSVHDAIVRALAEHGVADAVVERAAEAPQREAGGKFRRIIPFVPAR